MDDLKPYGLTLLIALPLAAGLAAALFPKHAHRSVLRFGWAVTAVNGALIAWICWERWQGSTARFAVSWPSLPAFDVSYGLSVDGWTLMSVVLTFLAFALVQKHHTAGEPGAREMIVATSILYAGVVGTLLAPTWFSSACFWK